MAVAQNRVGSTRANYAQSLPHSLSKPHLRWFGQPEVVTPVVPDLGVDFPVERTQIAV